MFRSTWLLWEITSQGEALAPASRKKSAGALASPESPGPFLYGTKGHCVLSLASSALIRECAGGPMGVTTACRALTAEQCSSSVYCE